MSTPAPQALDRTAVPWLFATALATTLPHVPYQPAWLSAIAAFVFAWGFWLWRHGLRLPGGWLLAGLVAIGCLGVFLEFHTLFGRQAGLALLFLLMAMKLLELRSRRDAYIVVNLAYFLLLTHYFNSQGIPTGIWLLGAMTVVTATLIRLHGGPTSTALPTLRYAGLLILQSLPFLLVLYLFFPRINGPLWGLPKDAYSAQSGLSDQMSLGNIASLALSGEIAFRAHFDGPLPNRGKLYWRGPVMEDYDGITWRRSQVPGSPPTVEALSPSVSYEITLEPHSQRWLLALDAPTALPPETILARTLSVVAATPVNQRQRYVLASSLDYRFNAEESDASLRRSLQLPPRRNPRTRALAEEWRRADPNPESLVQRALAYFRQQGFSYTLEPPPVGQEPVDDFLFETRLGFCEHYAAAFAVLMRSAGIPARVVGGYQGGEMNPVDGYLMVRQSDAHAWDEVWLEGRGWVRVDPTAAVAPSRVESGLNASIPANALLPGLIATNPPWLQALRYRWEAVNNAWNQLVLGYNSQAQRKLISRLGIPDPDWLDMSALLLAAAAIVLAGIAAWTLQRRPHPDPARRLWLRALARLRRRRISCEPWETPFALVHRLRPEHPELAQALETVATAYCRARYGSGPTDLAALRAAVARLP